MGNLQFERPDSSNLTTDVGIGSGGEVLEANGFEDHCLNQIRIQVSKIQTQNDANSEKFAQITNLKAKGQEMLEIGELETAEAIFDKALLLFKHQGQ